jgi:phosphate transport system permease protein
MHTSSRLHAEIEMPRAVSERVIAGILFVCGVLSIATTVGIVAVLLSESLGFFREVSLRQFLTDRQWTPLFADKHFGIWPLLAGTLLTTAIAIAVAVPLGPAIYLAEFAGASTRRSSSPRSSSSPVFQPWSTDTSRSRS